MRVFNILSVSAFFVFIASMTAFSASAETSNRVVAIVNSDVITLYELNKRIEEITGKTLDEITAEDEKASLETRRQVLELLIDEKIAQEKIRELGLKVSQSQIDAAIEDIKKSSNLTQEDLTAELKKQGISYEKYREMIKINLERSSLINYEVNSKIIIRVILFFGHKKTN